jgi:hypothetical protein
MMPKTMVRETDSLRGATAVVEAGARGSFSVQKNNTGYSGESLAIFLSPDNFRLSDLVQSVNYAGVAYLRTNTDFLKCFGQNALYVIERS